MTRLAGLLAVAMGLVAVIAWEVSGTSPSDVAPTPRQIAAHVASPAKDVDRTQEWVATVLARPLFSPDRRPAMEATAAATTGLPGLPRLAGIMVGPFGRSAIFAGDRKPIVVQEGARIDAYTVKAIDAAQVRLLGPDGMRVLYPTFQQSGSAAIATAVPARRLGQAALPR